MGDSGESPFDYSASEHRQTGYPRPSAENGQAMYIIPLLS